MKRSSIVPLLRATFIAGRCATQQEQLAARQEGAVDTALRRGRFDLNRPAA